MKASTIMRWVGPVAIAGGVLMVFSDLLNLTVYVPGLGEAAYTSYQAVGSGVILIALTLLLVGMIGLYARQPSSARANDPSFYDGLDLPEEDASGKERFAAERNDARNVGKNDGPVTTPTTR